MFGLARIVWSSLVMCQFNVPSVVMGQQLAEMLMPWQILVIALHLNCSHLAKPLVQHVFLMLILGQAAKSYAWKKKKKCQVTLHKHINAANSIMLSAISYLFPGAAALEDWCNCFSTCKALSLLQAGQQAGFTCDHFCFSLHTNTCHSACLRQPEA